ncbi:histidine kinase [Streptomyces sp. RY43-2]|uniref:histidine kinase n=1 Tax=Streptomyces macrolidinus TaxID=2952607 RepID=A0ABT0ZM83_9ACTN|nr:histidine kinase [Streptomyces macrolidinus]MCN9244693.1 histidine kinase [Streptomyces macrolidinus]
MDRHIPLSPAVRRVVTVSGLLAFALTWTADLILLSRSPDPFGSPTTWLPLLVTGPLTVLAVLDTPWSPSLDRRVAVVVTLSLALTLWSLIEPRGLTWWGALETTGLLILAIRTTARPGRPATAAAWTIAICVDVLLLPLRARAWSTFVAGGYTLTVALAVCVTIGCAVRALEARRERTAREVRQAERLALARDLHDLIAHHMTDIIVQANAALTIHTVAPDKVEPILRTIARSGGETLESMRRLVRVLREDNHTALRPGDLLTELGDLVSAHSATAHDEGAARLEATAAARTARLSPEVEVSVHRVVQEALTNIRRHAPGTRTVVHLDAEPAWLRVTVTNTPPARAFAAPTGGRGGFGLLGLRERVEALDGTLHAGPLPGGGWQVQATLPLVAPPPSAP